MLLYPYPLPLVPRSHQFRDTDRYRAAVCTVTVCVQQGIGLVGLKRPVPFIHSLLLSSELRYSAVATGALSLYAEAFGIFHGIGIPIHNKD